MLENSNWIAQNPVAVAQKSLINEEDIFWELIQIQTCLQLTNEPKLLLRSQIVN